MSKGKKILVVDDDPDVLEQVGIVLGADGHEIVTAAGEEDGREALLSSQPDLVVLDLMMEHKDSGFVLAHHIKKLYPQTPVILLTSVASATGMSFTASTNGGRSWVKTESILDKPVRPEQLRAEVRRLLGPPKEHGG